MTVIAVQTGHPHVAAMALCLAGALIGFLAYNLPPASIFLGDSGSMVIGLMVGLISIQGALKTSATLSITIPAVVMCVPMLDTVFAIIRRRLAGVPFDVGDRGHIHHKLLERGLTDWQALCFIGALCLTTGAAATAATIFRFDSLGWMTAISLTVALIWTRAFGHHEVTLAYKRLLDWTRRGKSTTSSHQPEGAAPSSSFASWDETWQFLLDEVTTRGGQGCELLLANDAGQSRYSVRVPRATRAQKTELRMFNVRGSAGFGQLQILGVPASDHDAAADEKLTALIEAMLRHWQARGPAPAPAGLVVEWHHSPIPARLRAA
jgi:UDP-GlcNAc:undecaprenyl-phosphate/decaprenyl-phosphate GlcNAc-1-phosphate transferase